MSLHEVAKRTASSLLSPKTVAFLKLGIALIGVYHAAKEVKDLYKAV